MQTPEFVAGDSVYSFALLACTSICRKMKSLIPVLLPLILLKQLNALFGDSYGI